MRICSLGNSLRTVGCALLLAVFVLLGAALPGQAWADTAVAKIGDNEYATLQEAVDKAQNGDTITVLDDINLTAGLVIQKGQEVTIDLNGNKVSYSSDVAGDSMVKNEGDLTITDGSASGEGEITYTYNGSPDSSYGKGNYTVLNTGMLKIEAGAVKNETQPMSHAFYAISTHAGDVTVNGGKVISQNGQAIRVAPYQGATSLTVNGGYVEGTRAVQVQLPSGNPSDARGTSVSVTGGELKSNETTYNFAIYVYSNGESAENSSVSISGGIINGNVALDPTSSESMKDGSVSITGGTIAGEYGVFSYSYEESAKRVISITGGTFANNSSEYYAEDDGYVFKANDDGTFEAVDPDELEDDDEGDCGEGDEGEGPGPSIGGEGDAPEPAGPNGKDESKPVTKDELAKAGDATGIAAAGAGVALIAAGAIALAARRRAA